MPVIPINGVALNYSELGSRDKRTIVFTHPVLFGSEAVEALASELADDFHLVLLDIHGHGASGYRTPMTLEEMAADYYQLLTKLGLSKVVWVGYSIGGMIGMRLALQHPEAIDSLVLMATAARPDPPELREQTWPLWEMFRDGHREDIIDGALPFFFAPATFKDRPQLVEHYRNKVINYKEAQGIFESARAVFERTDIGGQIGAIKAPTLVIAGKEDTIPSPAEAELIAERIPNARLEIVHDANHLVAVEKPREVARLIRDFLG